MNTMIRVMTVDDHPLVREGLRFMFATSDDLVLVGDAADGEAALQLINEVQPDVILLDIRMPSMDGLEALGHIRKTWPQAAVLILTTYDEYTKLNVDSRASAVAVAMERGLLMQQHVCSCLAIMSVLCIAPECEPRSIST